MEKTINGCEKQIDAYAGSIKPLEQHLKIKSKRFTALLQKIPNLAKLHILSIYMSSKPLMVGYAVFMDLKPRTGLISRLSLL